MDVLGEAWVKISPQLDSFEGEVESKVGAAAGAAGDSGAKILTERLTPAAAVIAAATGAIAESYNAAKSSIVAATGASGEALERLLGVTRQVATSGVSTSLGEIGEVVGLISQRLKGLSSQQTEDLTRSIVKLAEITGGDASASVEHITDLFERWNVPTAQQVSTLDRLYAASQRAGVPMETLVSLLATNAGTLQRFGFSLEQTVGVITQIEQAGGDAAPVLAALNQAFAKLASEGLEPVGALEALSASIIGAKTDAEAMQIGVEGLGIRAARVLVPAMRSGALEAGKFAGALDAGVGSIDRTHEATRSLGDRFREVRSFIGAAIAPASQYAAVLATIAAGVGPVVQGLQAIGRGASGMIAPLRAQQAAAALSGRSLSLAGAASNQYGGSIKKAAIGAGVFTAAVVGVGIVLSQHEAVQQRIAQGADTVTERLLAGSFSMKALSNEAANGYEAFQSFAKGVEGANNALDGQIDALHLHGGALTAGQQAAVDAARAEGNYAKALAIVEEAQRAAAASGDDLTQTHKQQAAAAREAQLAELALAGGLVGIASSVLLLRDAQRSLGNAETRVARLRARGKQGTKEYAEALREERRASLQVLTGQNSLTQSVLDFARAQKEAGASTKDVIADVRAQGREAGLTGGQIADLIGLVRRVIPANKDFGASGKAASGVAKAAFNAVKGAMGPVGAAIRTAGRTGGAGFSSASRGAAGASRAAYAGIPGALSFLPGAFGALGSNAAASFAAGLSGMISRAAAIAGAAVAAARNAMQIGSPSRAFMNLGYESRRGYMLEFDKLPDDVSRTVDRALSNLRSGGAAPKPSGTGGLGAAPTHAGTSDIEEAFERVAKKMGGLSPVIVQGGVLDLTEATGLADQARRRRAVLLGGRRFS